MMLAESVPTPASDAAGCRATAGRVADETTLAVPQSGLPAAERAAEGAVSPSSFAASDRLQQTGCSLLGHF
jgi:hypothetical protein